MFFAPIRHRLRSTQHWLSNIVLPSTCIFCTEQTLSYLNICADCLNNLPILSQTCPQCAVTIQTPHEALLCGDCLTTPPPFAKTFTLFPYQPPIIKLITDLKFQGKLNYARTLGALLIQHLSEKWYIDQKLPDIIIPVPLHLTRLRSRGFNQALEIARPVAKHFRLPIDLSPQRIRPTLAQSSLNAKERQTNIADAFFATRNYHHLQIAVLDDVITTGHTVREFCQLLRKQGAADIHVWCCARR